MVSGATVYALLAAAALLYAVLASPLPSEDAHDANASAPSNFLNCANGVGQGNGLNNCTIPSATGGMPSIPEAPEGLPSVPDGFPSVPEDRPSVSQGVDCATAVGQGNSFTNCTNIFRPDRSSG